MLAGTTVYSYHTLFRIVDSDNSTQYQMPYLVLYLVSSEEIWTEP